MLYMLLLLGCYRHVCAFQVRLAHLRWQDKWVTLIYIYIKRERERCEDVIVPNKQFIKILIKMMQECKYQNA